MTCGNGVMCRHDPECSDLDCEGHPGRTGASGYLPVLQNAKPASRTDEDKPPLVTPDEVYGWLVELIVCVIAIVALVCAFAPAFF